MADGQYNASTKTWADLARVPLQVDANGNLKTVSGGSGTTSTQVQGNVASGVADSGNPVKVGAKYVAVPPALTDGFRTDLMTGARGALRTEVVGSDGATAASVGTPASDGLATSVNGLTARALNYGLNAAGTWDRLRGDTNGLAVQSALSANFWSYAAASGGISNTTTAVTIKAAAGASVRNYLKTMQIDSDALGAATEIAIRDGAAGTVLWRGKISTAGYPNGRQITFDPPLKGTANTLMEVVTLTASVTGAVFVSAQGYTGA